MKWRRFVILLLAFSSVAAAQDYDVLIRNGRVVDGTGAPWRYADIGIRDGKIVAIGDLKEDEAKKEIDAKGLIVAPGFIDIHNHSDNTILVDGKAESMIRQGVTTMIFGEGGSAAPLGGKQDRTSEKAAWNDFDGYFAAVRKKGVATNIATYVGSSQIWTYVRGPRAGPPTAAERAAMQEEVRKAMRQGALGVASSLSGPPGSWIDADTLVAMCQAAAEFGGIYSTHLRTEGQGVFEAVAEAIEIGRRAKVPVDIIHLKLADHKLWGQMPKLIEMIEKARAEGQQVTANVYPYRAGQNNLSSIIPPWAHEGGTDAMLARLRDAAQRPKIREQVLNGIPGTDWYNHYTATGSWEGMLLVSLSNPAYKKFEGKRMNEVITALALEPVEALFKVLEDNRGSVPTIYFHHSENDMKYALAREFVSIGSDGTAVATEGPLAQGHPHPRYYGTFPRVLGRYVREEKTLRLEDAIRKMTSANASKIGILDRGVLRPGMRADVAIFDAAKIIDESTWDQPHRYATGVSHVIVNGQVVLDGGKHTGALPGEVLPGPGKASTRLSRMMSDREAAEWAIRYGGNVRLVGDSKRLRTLPELPDGDFRIEAMDLVGTIIDPKELVNLSGLSELKELFLPGPIFNPGAGSRLDANEELKALNTLRKLEKLHFSLHFLTNINVQDKGLEKFADLTQLTEMRLSQTRVKGPGLAPFTKLRKLDLNYSTFEDSGFPYLAKMKDLEQLSLRDTMISDAGLQHLAGLTNLRSLDLYGAKVTDAGVRHLAGLTKLESLDLLGASISDEGIEVISKLAELRELNLYRSPVTNAGLEKLKQLRKLRSLDLRYTRVTPNALADFRRAMPDVLVEYQGSAPVVASTKASQAPKSTAPEAIAQWIRELGGKAEITQGKLISVDLSGSSVTDAQLVHLRALENVATLRLASTEVGDAAIPVIASMPSLRSLDLGYSLVTPKGVAQLAKLPQLERLGLAGLGVDDATLALLGTMKNLRGLNLSYTEFTDAGLKHLAGLTQLESLDLTSTDLGDEGMEAVGKLTSLRELMISYGRFTDTGLAQVANLKALVHLELARTRATDDGLAFLKGLSQLKRLNVDYTSTTDKLLANLPALEELSMDTSTITDASIATLSAMRSLKHLNLYHTLVSEKGFEQLKAALPECRIVYDRDSSLPTRRRS
jgi:N-acyl-D-amino-acid deacylase